MDRLFEIVYLLLDQKAMTAGQLAEHFAVSTRTIYRDVDLLAQAGVPIHASKGHNGGIQLTEGFVVEKPFLSQREREGIRSSLQGMHTAGEGAEPALSKLAALFDGGTQEWVTVDLSPGEGSGRSSSRFRLLKQAVLERRLVRFLYSGSRGEITLRLAEPMKLVYKEGGWYLLAWCRLREDFRFFKLTHMRELSLGEETFVRRLPPAGPVPGEPSHSVQDGPLTVIAAIRPELAWRVYDEIPPDQREELPDGSFRVTFHLTEGEWAYSYLAGFGAALTILSPEPVRREFIRRCRSTLKNYEGKSR